MPAAPERMVTSERAAGPLAAAGVQKLYMPTALLKEQLPSGIGTLGRVPKLGDFRDGSESERMQESEVPYAAKGQESQPRQRAQAEARWQRRLACTALYHPHPLHLCMYTPRAVSS